MVQKQKSVGRGRRNAANPQEERVKPGTYVTAARYVFYAVKALVRIDSNVIKLYVRWEDSITFIDPEDLHDTALYRSYMKSKHQEDEEDFSMDRPADSDSDDESDDEHADQVPVDEAVYAFPVNIRKIGIRARVKTRGTKTLAAGSHCVTLEKWPIHLVLSGRDYSDGSKRIKVRWCDSIEFINTNNEEDALMHQELLKVFEKPSFAIGQVYASPIGAPVSSRDTKSKNGSKSRPASRRKNKDRVSKKTNGVKKPSGGKKPANTKDKKK